jgi:hypothetical protein
MLDTSIYQRFHVSVKEPFSFPIMRVRGVVIDFVIYIYSYGKG